ncbi:GNAT family N-acetyltransferase [Niameybacter massiliensis]|uniref:GNAT family N-acetyltransferase n=1 Tax=Holtiella tumoricola TaxID=3018743 RepID=A0AA42IZL8_9FIRM|nr:GNAT family N-acetyltransferase [Holtiella tumoricola]MDA3730459.1 GNAT family N-acetyltransferase [Holtiella tumoricola]
MSRLRLVLPSLADKERVMDYREEFIRNNERMDGCATLREANTFEEWYQVFQDTLKEETVRPGFVPATTYLAVDGDEKLIGMIDIRHRLNEYLLNYGGHIGYSVRKSERRQGYATEMLGLALEKCVELGIKEVLVTCNKENVASAKTILSNGGRLEDERSEEEVCIQRYWIHLGEIK